MELVTRSRGLWGDAYPTRQISARGVSMQPPRMWGSLSFGAGANQGDNLQRRCVSIAGQVRGGGMGHSRYGGGRVVASAKGRGRLWGEQGALGTEPWLGAAAPQEQVAALSAGICIAWKGNTSKERFPKYFEHLGWQKWHENV